MCLPFFNRLRNFCCEYAKESMIMKKAEKRTEYISFRTDTSTKAILEKLADEKKWSISQLVEEIVKDWLQEKK